MRTTMIMLLVVFTSAAHGQELRSKFLPPKGKTLVFVDGDEGSHGYKAWQNATGTEPSGKTTWINEWDKDLQWFWGFLCSQNDQSHAALLNMHIPGNQIEDFADGKYDENLRFVGRTIKQSGRPVYALLLSEYTGGLRHKPAAYVRAFRHMHDVWVKEGAEVAYVFDAVNGFGERSPWWRYYPGDRYVDWFGIAVYHVGNIPTARVMAATARKRNKPIMVCETGPLDIMPAWREDWDTWYAPYFRFVRECDVRAIQYWGEGEGVFAGGALHRLSPGVRSRLVAESKKARYLQGDDRLFDVLGFRSAQAAARR